MNTVHDILLGHARNMTLLQRDMGGGSGGTGGGLPKSRDPGPSDGMLEWDVEADAQSWDVEADKPSAAVIDPEG